MFTFVYILLQSIQLVNNEPRKKEKLKWNGWGYTDTKFVITKENTLYLSGHRYSIAGIELPYLRDFVEKEMGVNIEDKSPPKPMPKEFPKPNVNEEFVKQIEDANLKLVFDGLERLNHSHGHTVQELWDVRYGEVKRIPDVVIYPRCHEDVEIVVKAANDHNVVIIPYGGGTSVSRAVQCPENEKRMIVSLDMKDMDKIKWVDRDNMTACIETGIIGKELTKKLEDIGLTMGHEPDSLEFSTLGGWIATRASGMKKNVYGNIEDIVVNFKFVSPVGSWEYGANVPRVSSGPELRHIVLGSEGTLGVVTEAIVKVRNLPEVKKYGSLAFPTFEHGVKFMHDVALHKAQPASIRLVDPMQLRFGQGLRPGGKGWLHDALDKAKKLYLSKFLKFDLNELAAVTLVFEGTAQEVKDQEKIIYYLAKKNGGIKGDEENGRRGYFLTFAIAYLRDLGFDLSYLGESFETSVPWSKTYNLCMRVKERIVQETKRVGVPTKPFVSCRVTQTYDCGSCVYFYIGFSFKGVENAVEKFDAIEHAAREEILACGGSISHHHGVGKHRKDFMVQSVQPVGLRILRGIKHTIDPKNIFANGNLLDFEDPNEPILKSAY